jgi:hypothetical protein
MNNAIALETEYTEEGEEYHAATNIIWRGKYLILLLERT